MIKIDKTGHIHGGGQGYNDVLVALAQSEARNRLAATTALTDNSGGVAASALVEVAAFANVADSGSSLAQEADTQTSFLEVKNALAEIFAKANDLAVKLGVKAVPYDGTQSAAPDGTIAAIDDTITGATTGVQATEMNALRVLINTAMASAGELVNKVSAATGFAKISVPFAGQALSGVASPGGAIDHTATGTAADPGVTLVATAAALDTWADNIATMAAQLNEIVTSTAALTDNSGGIVHLSETLVRVGPSAADADVSGGSGHTEATTETSLGTVKDALAELFAKANALAAVTGVSTVTYNGGGASVDGTIAAIGDSGAAGVTGATKASLDPLVDALDDAFDTCAVLVNRSAAVVGLNALILGDTLHTVVDPVAALGVDITMNASGQSKVLMDAKFVAWEANVATIAKKIADVITALDGPRVVVV